MDASSLIRLLAPPVILIVDDDTAIQMMLTEVLAMEGYRAESASDGRGALDLLQTSGPYVVVLDLTMPYMDGAELLTALNELPHVRRFHWIILMSGRTDLQEMASALGADSALPMPFMMEEFLRAVSEGLRRLGHESSLDLRN